MCRAWGCFPHELPPRGTAEREFIHAEWQKRNEERANRAENQNRRNHR